MNRRRRSNEINAIYYINYPCSVRYRYANWNGGEA